MIAGLGGDTVNGGNGKDRLIGGAGADTLNGKAGKDFLDTRDGAHGNDHADGRAPGPTPVAGTAATTSRSAGKQSKTSSDREERAERRAPLFLCGTRGLRSAMEDWRIFQAEEHAQRRTSSGSRTSSSRDSWPRRRSPSPAVSIFGSARVREDHPAYEAARETARLFADAGFSRRDRRRPRRHGGRQPRGQEGGGLSVGFNIELPHEQESNPYLDLALTFRHFYARKTMFVKAGRGVRHLPRRLRHAGRALRGADPDPDREGSALPSRPLRPGLLAGLLDWIRDRLLAEGMISPEDQELLVVTDEPAEAVATVVACYERRCAEMPAAPAKADAE